MAGRRLNGEGTVRQRTDGRWEAMVSLPHGRRISRYGATQKEAQAKLKEARRQVDDGIDLSASTMTVEQFLSTWIDSAVKPAVKVETYESYESIVRVRVIPRIGKVKLLKLSPIRVQQFYAELALGDDAISNLSIQHTHRVLKQAMQQAIRWNMLSRNPCDGVTPPRAERAEMDVWSAAESSALLDTTAEHNMHALYMLALSTGMRQGELLGLKWNDVDLEGGRLQVHRSLQYQKGNGLVFVEPKTARSRRPIKLGKRAVDALKAHRKAQLEIRLKAGSLWQEQDLVFPTDHGAPHDPSWQYKVFKRATKDAGLRSIRFHDMRHTAATLLLTKNVHVKVVSEMLGHSSITITLNTYSQYVPSLHDEAADVMDSLLSA